MESRASCRGSAKRVNVNRSGILFLGVVPAAAACHRPYFHRPSSTGKLACTGGNTKDLSASHKPHFDAKTPVTHLHNTKKAYAKTLSLFPCPSARPVPGEEPSRKTGSTETTHFWIWISLHVKGGIAAVFNTGAAEPVRESSRKAKKKDIARVPED
ncbi:uncharacterized protein UV8b_08006 [Ustilaginoidea virens]|uniref:Uncharacterized protein n=1 Tax=Ustilaginoidea virens TaxID=1159556 RepID=A0A8E5HY35_USTVR|nr:uncharacterized protein UV8b_08006 [Ustilaginoidea virens]QUC23765.1 hypothetical protein UV8b_08006 [Ustilaginoidea virens]